MTLLNLTLPDPAANLALDEALLLAAEEGTAGEVLRLWECPTYAVVLGAGGKVADEVDVAACEEDDVPILRRASGGGTVVIGPRCLCASVVLRSDSSPDLAMIRSSARYVMGRMRNALALLVPFATVEDVSDLAIEGRKFSGSAQQRKRSYFLHHSTFLCGLDLDRVSRYLHVPERQPGYRGNRPHGDFLTSLPADADTLRHLIAREWMPEGDYGPVPLAKVEELVSEKYGRRNWNRRR
jgi:lipoate-protein ligase A